jgi:fumarate reductase subunit C
MARPYPRTVSNIWWLKRWPYRIFMLRELSSVFLAAYVVLLLVLVTKVQDGAKEFADYLDVLQSPVLIAFHAVALLFVLLHTVTWFQAVPKGLPLRLGEERVPPALMIGASYVAWLVVTVVVAAIFLL